jgi:hypothetical protein
MKDETPEEIRKEILKAKEELHNLRLALKSILGNRTDARGLPRGDRANYQQARDACVAKESEIHALIRRAQFFDSKFNEFDPTGGNVLRLSMPQSKSRVYNHIGKMRSGDDGDE